MDNYMKAEISYQEILALLSKKVSYPIALQYVSADTVAVSTSVKVWFVHKSVTVNIKVVQIDDADVTIQYSGGFGLSQLMNLILQFINSKGEFDNLYKQIDDNQIVIHLDKIPQLQSTLDVIMPTDIAFNETGIKVVAVIR